MDRSNIEKLAELARIELNDATVDDVTKRITDIIKLVDQLKAAATDKVEPMAHPLDTVQRLRADQVTEVDQREAFQAIAPCAEAGLYLVPKVIE